MRMYSVEELYSALQYIKFHGEWEVKCAAQHSAKCVTDQLYKKLEVTCTTVHYKPIV